MSEGSVFFLCQSHCNLPRRSSGAPRNVYQWFCPGSCTQKFAQTFSPPLLNFYGVKKCEILPQFLTSVTFEVLWFSKWSDMSEMENVFQEHAGP